jgi:hypothetical protein
MTIIQMKIIKCFIVVIRHRKAHHHRTHHLDTGINIGITTQHRHHHMSRHHRMSHHQDGK